MESRRRPRPLPRGSGRKSAAGRTVISPALPGTRPRVALAAANPAGSPIRNHLNVNVAFPGDELFRSKTTKVRTQGPKSREIMIFLLITTK